MNAAATTRRDQRLRAIARQIIRHGYSAEDVATCLARTALEYAERNIGDAARVLGLPADELTATAAILRGQAAASGAWQTNHGGLPRWPDEGDRSA